MFEQGRCIQATFTDDQIVGGGEYGNAHAVACFKFRLIFDVLPDKVYGVTVFLRNQLYIRRHIVTQMAGFFSVEK